MTRTVVMKADAICDGDRIKADGVIYTVKRARQIKRKIPARYEKQVNLILETKGKVNGRSSKKQEITTLFNDDEVEVMSRPGMQWKVDRFKEANARYINTFACALTGSGITLATGLSGLTPMLASMGMLGLTLMASVLVYVYTE